MKPNYKRVNRFKASQMTRFYNLIIDSIFLFTLNYCIGMIIGLLYVLTNSMFILKLIYSLEDKLINWMFGAVTMILYYFLFEYFSKGRTIGKLITGTCVVDINGLTPSRWEFFTRTLSRIVPFEAFSFLSSVDRGWHDRWSDTAVVQWKDYNEDIQQAVALDELGKST